MSQSWRKKEKGGGDRAKKIPNLARDYIPCIPSADGTGNEKASPTMV